MRREPAAVATLVFLVVVPGTVVGLVPWWLTGWQAEEPLPYWAPLRVVGVLLIGGGLAVLLSAFVRFVAEGAGTPAPIAPPAGLVVGGLYRYVRNPMYVAVVAVIVGQALVLGQPVLLLYAAVAWSAMAGFVHWYEEPALHRRFGPEYDRYRSAVPAWWPGGRRRAPH